MAPMTPAPKKTEADNFSLSKGFILNLKIVGNELASSNGVIHLVFSLCPQSHLHVVLSRSSVHAKSLSVPSCAYHPK